MSQLSTLVRHIEEIHEIRNQNIELFLDWQELYNSVFSVAILLKKKALQDRLAKPIRQAITAVLSMESLERHRAPSDYKKMRVLISLRRELMRMEVSA